MEAVGPSPVCPHPLDPGGWFQGERLLRAGSSKGEEGVDRAPGDPGPLCRLPRRRSKWTRCRSSALTAARLLCAWTRTSGRSCRVWSGRKVGAPSPASAPLPPTLRPGRVGSCPDTHPAPQVRGLALLQAREEQPLPPAPEALPPTGAGADHA